jgi:hypothetical protein
MVTTPALQHLGESFNKMTQELRRQRNDLVEARDQMDRRRREGLADEFAAAQAEDPLGRRVGDGHHACPVDDLGESFNKMTQELRRQRNDLVEARDQMDRRRRFTGAGRRVRRGSGRGSARSTGWRWSPRLPRRCRSRRPARRRAPPR